MTEADLADWRRYFGDTPVTDDELAALDELAMMYADHSAGDILDAYRAGRAGVESARAAAVALEQECAVLADTLSLFTHDAAPSEEAPGYCRSCGSRVDDARHRTPGWLRKRYGFGI